MMPSDPIQAMEFAQSKGQARKDGKTGISFGDIAGMESTKKELQEVVEVRLGRTLQEGAAVRGSRTVQVDEASGICRNLLVCSDIASGCNSHPQ